MKAIGLEPGGDLKNGTRAWTQDVPLAQFETDGPVKHFRQRRQPAPHLLAGQGLRRARRGAPTSIA